MLAIERACFPREAYDGNLFRHYHARCGDLFLIAKRLGRIGGYMITCVEDGSAEVISIAVHPNWQRKGLGRRLMEHTLDRLAQADVKVIALMVRESSEAAIHLYEGFGFRRQGLAKRYYPDGGDGVRMSKSGL